MKQNYIFGVDIGGTTIKIGLFDTEGEILKKFEIKTRTENQGKMILPDIADAIRIVMKEKKIESNLVHGVGVGGGVIINGQIIKGAFGAGGEIGHIQMFDDEKELCGCGKCGCLEQYASATGIARKAKEVFGKKCQQKKCLIWRNLVMNKR